MSEIKIQQTVNYALFKTIKGNRETTEAHVRKLVSSIARKNLLPYAPILVNKAGEVIDGQHRLKAAEILGASVSYIVAPNADIRDVQLLNASQKQWALSDYAESYAEQGLGDYETLKNFYESQDIPVSIAVYLLTSNERRDGYLSKFKTGEFVVESMPEALTVMDKSQLFDQKAERQVRRSSGFVRALRSLIRGGKVDWDRMKNKLEVYPKQIPSYLTVRDYLRAFEDIYNYNNKIITRLY